jgi:RES domain-containing protein
MELYRICQEKYADDLSGNGARLYGGRWNSEGYYALYTSCSRSLALLETLAHTPVKILQQKTYVLVTISVPDDTAMQVVDIKKFPPGWENINIHYFTRELGDGFLKSNKKLLLKTPSILVYEEPNYVLNPLHPLMKDVKITRQRKLSFDNRLLRAF